jgi:hypothetical protein
MLQMINDHALPDWNQQQQTVDLQWMLVGCMTMVRRAAATHGVASPVPMTSMTSNKLLTPHPALTCHSIEEGAFAG